MKYQDSCIVVFARVPVPGQVKTRLIPALGAEGACRLHHRMCERLFATLHVAGLAPWELWIDTDQPHPLVADAGVPVHLQEGSDLGERLIDALEKVFQRFSRVVVIGTDCPGLDVAYLDEALQCLSGGEQVVLGPAVDGGYVLLGMASFQPALLQGISWGSSQVLEQTLARVRQLELSCHLLPTLADIDCPEDLHRLERGMLEPWVTDDQP